MLSYGRCFYYFFDSEKKQARMILNVSLAAKILLCSLNSAWALNCSSKIKVGGREPCVSWNEMLMCGKSPWIVIYPWWIMVCFFLPGPWQSYMKMQIGHRRISEAQLVISGNMWSRASWTASRWIIWNIMKRSFVKESKRGTSCPLQIYGDSSLIVCYIIRYYMSIPYSRWFINFHV